MKTAIAFLLFNFIIISVAFSQTTTALPQLGKSSVKDVIAAMTTEEKTHLVVGMGMDFSEFMPKKKDSAAAPAATGPVIGETMQTKVPGAAGSTYAIPRLGIPSIIVADGPAGLRIRPVRNNDSSKTFYCTAFPVATLLASTWDTALVKKVGVAFGNEVHEYGVDILLAPALNIHRNPLGGRNFEYYSEDPLIAGSMTAAIVNGIQSNGVGTSIKHFAANNQETNRNTVNTIVSERALRELYLKGFKMAVEKSQPWTVMSSYNHINGTYSSQNHDLLTTILRDEWKFKGFVMTDWFGGKNAIAQMQAGNDLLMPGTPQQTATILSAVQHDSLSQKILDENVAHILNIILQSPTFKQYQYSNNPDLTQHAQVARQAAAEGMVLLKNDNQTLPFTNIKTVALFGNTSYDLIAGGTGSGDVHKEYTVSMVQGLNNAHLITDAAFENTYTQYMATAKANRTPPKGFFDAVPPIKEMILNDDDIARQAAAADVAIITIGRNAGEGNDRKEQNDFTLSAEENTLIQQVSKAFHAKQKKVVIVLNIGGVIETASWRNAADAILLAWQPGLEGGNAITDILTGKINPSGRLATTFPMAYADVPSAKNFPGKEFPERATTGTMGMKMIPAEVRYEEGIYVGYRYYNSFGVKTAYPFGYGLSYTNFSYSPIKLNSAVFTNSITATVTVTNTGKTAGKNVAELYLAAPKGNLDKPAEELKGFAKTNLLQPGQSQQIIFTLTAADLASFNTGASAWIADKGNYTIKIGASSEDIKQTASFTLAKEMVTEKVHKALAPQEAIDELKK